MSDEIDRDAELIGIDPKIWKEFRMRNWKEERGKQWRELPKERELPLEREMPPKRLVQGEFESITGPIDDKEAFIRHKEAMARRAFAWYRLSKKKDKSKLIDIYNGIATMKQRD